MRTDPDRGRFSFGGLFLILTFAMKTCVSSLNVPRLFRSRFPILHTPRTTQPAANPATPARSQPTRPSQQPTEPTQPAANPAQTRLAAHWAPIFPLSTDYVDTDHSKNALFFAFFSQVRKKHEKLPGLPRRTHSATIVNKKKKYGKVRTGTHFHQKGP
jgi:hypothetical protein